MEARGRVGYISNSHQGHSTTASYSAASSADCTWTHCLASFSFQHIVGWRDLCLWVFFFFFFFFFNFALILGAKRHFIYFFLKQLKDDSHILLLPALFPAAHTHVSSPAYSQSSTICAESSFHQPGFPQHTSCRWNLQHTHSPGPLGDGDTHVGCFPRAAEEGHSMLTLIS